MNRLMQILPIGLILIFAPAGLKAQNDNEPIRIIGSSTVYPFVTIAAEKFSENTDYEYPNIIATGTGAGMMEFCENNPDIITHIVTASRRISPKEEQVCIQNAQTEIIEIKLGYDGIGLTRSRLATSMALSLHEIYLALAKSIPSHNQSDDSVSFIPNPYKYWNEINPNLPNEPIKFYGPPITSGTRDAFNELVLSEGCSVNIEQHCTEIRNDGVYSAIGENDDLIVQRLQTNDTAIGIIGFNFLNRHNAILSAIPISHDDLKPELPTGRNITIGHYPISRTLYLYLNKQEYTNSTMLQAYVQELISDKAFGENGYLTQEGLIPLSPESRKATLDNLIKLRTLNFTIEANTEPTVIQNNN